MKYRTSQSEGEITLHIEDRLTFTDGEAFNAALAELTASGKARWGIDLRGLDFIDSFGLGLLVVLYDLAKKERAGLVLRGASGIVRDRLDYTRFSSILIIED